MNGSTCIRLSRGGSKKRPFYKIVVADQRAPRDGRFIERLGSYNPLLPKDHADRLILNQTKLKSWLGSQGNEVSGSAVPSCAQAPGRGAVSAYPG